MQVGMASYVADLVMTQPFLNVSTNLNNPNLYLETTTLATHLALIK